MTGEVLGNRYELLEKIGVGGMAIVYKALDKLLNRYVAVKILRSEFQGNEEFIRRFNIESQAAASLSHPNIVSIYDVGESGDAQYIVMEYIEGKTLKEYIAERKGNIYWKEATDIAMQICSALEHAHSKHIIHRDIKPQNIMISTDNVVKVTDFGIARAANNGTMTMEAMGSAHYLSPEQARGGYTDQKSDIYSLGVLMYELYTGKLPFDGDTAVAVAMQHMQVEPIRPTLIKVEIPQSIENIILKAMSKEQRLRYESAAWLLSDLKKAYYEQDIPYTGEESDEDKFGTKKITPIVNIDIPMQSADKTQEKKSEAEGEKGRAEERGEEKTAKDKTVVRRNPEERITKKKDTKKEKKKDTITIIAAVITCMIIATIMGIVVSTFISGGFSGKDDNGYNMPNVKGLDRDEAADMLRDLRNKGFEIEEVYAADANIPQGEVIDQEPKMGKIEEGEKIIITISSGKERINLDDYTNFDSNEAINQLEELGIDVKISQEMSNDVDEGKIIRQIPTAGSIIETGDSVRLFVSSGPNTFKVDNYVGTEYNEIKGELEAQDIVIDYLEEYSDTVPAGVIISQKPEGGTEMKGRDSIRLVVSRGAELMTVPSLKGYGLDAAKDALTNNSLRLGNVEETESAQAKGVVIDQSIAAGTKVQKNTTVDVKVSKGGAQNNIPDNAPAGGDAAGGANGNNGVAANNTSDTGL